jgi:hypothetical protein
MAVETGTCGGPLGSRVFFCRFIFELLNLSAISKLITGSLSNNNK